MELEKGILLSFFSHKNDLVFFNVRELLLKMGLSDYFLNDWRLYIDSFKRSLKCVLLHNGNRYGSILIAHSSKMK